MGLEFRGSSVCYYRKAWKRGRVESQCLGSGMLAVLAWRLDEEDRDAEAARQAAQKGLEDEQRNRIDALDVQVDAHVVAQEKAVTEALESAGFCRRKNRCLGWVKPREGRDGRG